MIFVLNKIVSFLSRYLKRKLVVKKAVISVIGPSGSGKTTLIRFMETGEPVQEDVMTTLGIDFRKKPIKFDKWSLNLIDVGGQQLYQDVFWELAIQRADAIIYVIDSLISPGSDIQKFNFNKEQFQFAIDHMQEEAILLILLNKQDMSDQNPITPQEFMKNYNANNLLMYKTSSIIKTSAKFGDGVDEALTWLIDILQRS